MLLQPADSYQGYQKLFSHLRVTSRAGVVQVGGKDFGAYASYFKEVYVFPLAASDPDPDFLSEMGFDRYYKLHCLAAGSRQQQRSKCQKKLMIRLFFHSFGSYMQGSIRCTDWGVDN
jgi:hypothetical protein